MFRLMLLSLLTLASLFIGTLSSQPPTMIGGDAQRYSEVSLIDTCTNAITVSNGFAYRPGDRVLMLQMKGAVIDSNESPFAGQAVQAGNVGHYQFNTVTTSTATSVLMLHPIDAQFDVANSVQCIRIISGRSLQTNAPLLVQPWNGGSERVLVIECSDTLFLNHDIVVNGQGFRGGVPSRNQADSNISRMFIDIDDGRGGQKGEGPVRLESRLACGKAPAISGGGGGNAGNGGGGGGAMISRGGHGGRQTTEYSRFDAGGVGGYPLFLDYSTLRLLVGSGGGGGHQNDFLGGRGGNGGGMVLISAKAIVANGARRIAARGADGDSTTADGAGGGGSGGMVILDLDTIVGDVSVDVRGGNGGMAIPFGRACYAPGGGGGGGLIGIVTPTVRRLISGNFFSNMDPGRNGVNEPELFQCVGERNLDATSGEVGEIVIVGPLRRSADTVRRPQLWPRDTTVCHGQQVRANVQGATSVRWIPASLVENPTLAVTRTVAIDRDTFIVAAMSIRGQCEVFDTLRIRLHPRQDSTLVAGPRGPCLGQPVSYSLPIATATVPQWRIASTSGSATKAAATVDTVWSEAGVIQVDVSFLDTNGCQQSVAFQITVSDSLTPTIQGLRPLCLGDSIVLDAGAGYDSYLWSNGSSDRRTVVRSIGGVSVVVASANGCQGSAAAVVVPGRQPSPRLAAPRFELESINDAITITIDDAGRRVEWSDGSSAPSLVVRRAGQYWAIVTSEDGCLGTSDTITIIGFRKGAPITLAVDDVRYRPGQQIDIRIRLRSTEQRLENIAVTFELVTNGTCIVPLRDATISSVTADRASGVVRASMTLLVDSLFVGENIIDIPAVGALGNEVASALRIDACSTTTDITDCEVVREGIATNEEVCREGGNRLFDGSARPMGIALEGSELRWTPYQDRHVFCIDAIGRHLDVERRHEGTTIVSRPVHQPAIMWWFIVDGTQRYVLPVLRE